MQERRGQRGRGLVCVLTANGLFWGSRQKTGRSFAAYGTISTRRRGKVVGNPGCCGSCLLLEACASRSAEGVAGEAVQGRYG